MVVNNQKGLVCSQIQQDRRRLRISILFGRISAAYADILRQAIYETIYNSFPQIETYTFTYGSLDCTCSISKQVFVILLTQTLMMCN